jgi:hypothetical protein
MLTNYTDIDPIYLQIDTYLSMHARKYDNGF